jgi:prolyl-tRNA synthetase
MPDGKAIQMGTSHHLGQKFSKPFEIKYLGKDEKEHFAWTTSWGLSWRVIGAAILTHGDDQGLILPPKVAPTQVVIIPIHYKESDKERIIDEAARLGGSLEKNGVRAFIDDRAQYTPGWKYHEWEMKGVPLRVEIGPRDLQSKQVTLVRRDTKKKMQVDQSEATSQITKVLGEIQDSLLQTARKTMDELTSTAEDIQSFKRIIEEKGGFVKAFLSENVDCEDNIKAETGATVRVVPFGETHRGKCVYCGKPDSREVFFARSY